MKNERIELDQHADYTTWQLADDIWDRKVTPTINLKDAVKSQEIMAKVRKTPDALEKTLSGYADKVNISLDVLKAGIFADPLLSKSSVANSIGAKYDN